MPAGNTLWTTSSKLNEPWTSTDLAPLELANASAAAMVRSGELPPARAGGGPASSSPSNKENKRITIVYRNSQAARRESPSRGCDDFSRDGSKDAAISPRWVKPRHVASLAEPVLLYAVAQGIA